MKVDVLQVLEVLVNSNNVAITIIPKEEHSIQVKNKTEEKQNEKIQSAMIEKIKNEFRNCKENTLYCVIDSFEEEYCFFQTPISEDEKIILIGPYRKTYMEKYKLAEFMEAQQISMLLINDLQEYYNSIPIIPNSNTWLEVISWAVKTLCGENECNIEVIDYSGENWCSSIWNTTSDVSKEITAKVLEERYQVEKELLLAISQGNTKKALKALNQLGKYKIERRYDKLYRDYRNLLIVFNTLCRKSVEQACVHPVHIDELSTRFAKQIETVYSEHEVAKMQVNMVRRYCMMVNNYSLRGYSPLIQKIVNYIELNLESDLSLKAVSEKFSLNSSYLSDVFKKEVGVTFTSYVNSKRIQQAILYLNSSHLQIQEIATEVGIPDVNYFTKLFKRIIGKTPREYRNFILSNK